MSHADTGKNDRVLIVGAGLAGCEAAWQLASAGIPVELVDMKPGMLTPAHQSTNLAELVCSNSLKAMRLTTASGLLKEEIRRLGSLVIAVADRSQVPAGGALAVDRDVFSSIVTEAIQSHPLIKIVERCVDVLPLGGIRIIATGPLTQGALFQSIEQTLGSKSLHFFDAAAPMVSAESIDRSIAFAQSRYGRGGDDYQNCPMDVQEYEKFWQALVLAEVAQVEDFDRNAVFESCMPIETMASRGMETIRFGPLKPVGLTDPRTGKQPHAVVQLRQDDVRATIYSLVGFQTRLRFPEQKRVFSMIPGLENAEFLRYGVMHRNSYIASPGILKKSFETEGMPGLFFAGQITGVEGYVESAASGLMAGIHAARLFKGESPVEFSGDTVIGALAAYVADSRNKHFQPMNANYGILHPIDGKYKKKEDRYAAMADRSLSEITRFCEATGWKVVSPTPHQLNKVLV